MLAVKEKLIAQDKTIPASPENLSLSLRNLILDEITENVFEQTPIVNQLATRIRNEIIITPLTKREDYVHVIGVDAGSQIIPLASRQYAVIGALAYSLPDGKRFFLNPESLSESYSAQYNFRSQVDVRREARLYETAYRYLERGSETELIFIDGPLAYSNWWQTAGKEADRQRFINAINRLLRICKESGIAIAGIVKRPSARYLIHVLGLNKETDFTDSFLMLHALKPGEMTEIFSPRMGLQMATKTSPIMDAVDTPIYSSYVRLTKEWQIPPVRIDVPDFCLDQLDGIANYCYSTSYWNGIPYPIVKADEAVKVTKRFISDVYSEVLGRVSRVNGEITQVAPFWGESGWMGV
ncbi:DNA double-strand break repair nuclease NurA [Candidatus Bathyarchaeota archaeon]|nr:DNA double-strand break repair nuclease NurA [Candidatus Bathyarchaeota archaeon]MBT7345869.1 DNA double-strand break repair nuclease NurA [Candidatus Bathyarchaeota archaeon]